MSTLPGYPLPAFKFQVKFMRSSDDNRPGEDTPLCSGLFSECSGIEATMEPKVIKEGGQNFGVWQRAGRVTFSTVILKRGMTTSRDLWTWFELVNAYGKYSFRLHAEVVLFDITTGSNGNLPPRLMTWTMLDAMPTKFKAADMNAKAGDVPIEELHFVHEGLTFHA